MWFGTRKLAKYICGPNFKTVERKHERKREKERARKEVRKDGRKDNPCSMHRNFVHCHDTKNKQKDIYYNFEA